MRRRISSSIIGLPVAVILLAGCTFVGASEITVDATNQTDQAMVVQVTEGVGPDAAPYGPAHTVGPGESQELELAVPGGDWAVTVNGGELVGSLDAGSRRGRLPVTLFLAEDGPYWQAPGDWAIVDP
jgi:hypothetical protein